MKKDRMLRSRVLEGLFRDIKKIGKVDQSNFSNFIELISNTVREQNRELDRSTKLYGEGRITLARAARDAGFSLWEMMDYVRQRKIPAQYDIEDLERDLRGISARLTGR